MRFQLIDEWISEEADRIVAIKNVTAAEEYLADHFPTFPVLPGVLMLEAMVQAARRWAAKAGHDPRLVLGEVRALRYGSFVRPGEALRVEVHAVGERNPGEHSFKGEGVVIRSNPSEMDRRSNSTENETAVSGRFTLRPVKRRVMQNSG